MKWKSLSPEAKRRESPKFKSPQIRNHAYYHYNDENYGDRGLENYGNGYKEEYEYIPPPPQSYLSGHSSTHPPYTSYPYQQQHQQQPSVLEIRLMEMERRERELQRELEFYRNQRNGPPVIKPEYAENYDNYDNYDNFETEKHTGETDEDDLYFHGGGTKKQARKAQLVDQIRTDEYDPIDFESTEPSSSWSSDEEDLIFVKKKQRQNKKLKTNTPNTTAVTRPKAYAPKLVDMDAPTFMKLPPNAIPSTWANLIHNPLKPQSQEECKEILVDGLIRSGDWMKENVLTTVQGILMRPPFDDDEFTIKKWAKFMQFLLPKVMPAGYLFIWVEREELAQVVRVCEKYLSFKYVENLCWIRRDLGNRIMKEVPKNSGLFYKSKMTLLILRRDPNNICKLRHQRNPDCILDFVGPGRMPDGRVYDVIETLLDGSKIEGPHLMHLWAGNSPTDRLVYQSRKHWIRVLEGCIDEGDIADIVDIADIADIVDITDTADTADNVDADTDNIAGNTAGNTDTILNTDTIPNTEPIDVISTNYFINETRSTSNICGANSSTFDEDFCNFIICEPIE